MAKLTASRHIFILLLIGICLGPLLWVCANKADSQQAVDRNVPVNASADSSVTAAADSTVSLYADSADGSASASASPLKRILLPLLITAATGGLLLLLYTQRGS